MILLVPSLFTLSVCAFTARSLLMNCSVLNWSRYCSVTSIASPEPRTVVVAAAFCLEGSVRTIVAPMAPVNAREINESKTFFALVFTIIASVKKLSDLYFK